MGHINYSVFKHELPDNMKWLEDRTILLTKAGSHIYGTNIETSDTDYKGVAIPPKEYLLGLKSINEYNKSGGRNLKERNTPEDIDLVVVALNKFVIDCLNGVPNNLDILFCRDEDILYTDEFGKELREIRHEFLSKECKNKFGGYAFAQKKRLINGRNGQGRPDLVEKFGYDTKMAMHSIRLLQCAIEILTTGDYHSYRPNHEELIDIRRGKYSFEEILEIIEDLDKQVQELFETSTLRAKPNYDKINNWLIGINERALNYDFSNKKLLDELDHNKVLSNFNMPNVDVTPNYTNIPPACQHCSNHPINGGSGICHCTLGIDKMTWY